MAALAAALICGGFSAVAWARPGDLDTSFGNAGKVVSNLGDSEAAAAGALQPDGKIVAAGYRLAPAGDLLVARYGAAGSLDNGFDGDGWVQTGFGADEQALSVAVQPDGKIVAAGFTVAGANPNNLALARYNANGSPDNGFDGDGKVTTDFGANEYGQEVAVQPDGKIVVAVYSDAGNLTVARWNVNGSPDGSFDGDGLAEIGFGGVERSRVLALQPDGKIVVAGETNTGGNPNNFALARFNPNGSPDNSFDGDGRLRTDFGASEGALGVAVQPDGKIVTAGTTAGGPNPNNLALARYNANGSPDNGFDGDGKVTTDFGAFEWATDVAIQANGKIVVGFTGFLAPPLDFEVVRYTADGGLDQGFGDHGRAQTDLGGPEAIGSVAIQPDGKIVAVGGQLETVSSDANLALARYEGDPPAGSDTSLTLTLDGKRKQKVKRLKVKVGCGDEACDAELRGKAVAKQKKGAKRAAAVKKKGKRFKVKPKTLSVDPGEKQTARVKFKKNRKSVRKMRRLLKRKAYRKKTKVKVKASATDAAGNTAKERKKVKLKR